MRRSLRLRPWQKRALDRFTASTRADFLAVATPGAGKTTFALAAALTDLAARPSRRVVVVAPTQHLKVQWARVASAFGLHLEPAWSSRQAAPPADMHGVALTYQQVAANPLAVAGVAADAFVILDEVHHAGEERAWGEALASAFAGAARRLSLSGTPFRSDTVAIPFVRYDAAGQAQPDDEYGYGDALAEGGVVRPVFFPRVDGAMEWTAPDGTRHAHTFTDPLDRERANQRLRTALSVEGQWLPAVLSQAHTQLRALRRHQPDAGGLVIAMDVDHARGIARLLRERHGTSPVVATSDAADASARIASFAESSQEWIVAVRMVSEGVDIPRLRVGVYATNTTTELFFRQAVGRLVRWRAGVRRQKAFLFIPDDGRLRAHAAGVAEQRRHTLRQPADSDPAAGQERAVADRGDEQLSLFAAISAVPLGDAGPALLDDDELAHESDVDEAGVEVALAAPPLPSGTTAQQAPGGRAPTRQEHKRTLRSRNAEQAKTIASLSGRTHAQVNAELNRLAGIRRISDATVDQLERRLHHAGQLLRRI
jgi:superfamily II DNA or RNA helicase